MSGSKALLPHGADARTALARVLGWRRRIFVLRVQLAPFGTQC